MRKIYCNSHYNSKIIIICENDKLFRQISIQLAFKKINFSMIEFDEKKKSIDQIC